MTNQYNASRSARNVQEDTLLVRYLTALRCHCIRTATIHLQRLAALRWQLYGTPRQCTYGENLAQADERERKPITGLLVQRHEYKHQQ